MQINGIEPLLGKMIVELSDTREKRTEILEAVKSSLGVLNNFLTGMEKTYS